MYLIFIVTSIMAFFDWTKQNCTSKNVNRRLTFMLFLDIIFSLMIRVIDFVAFLLSRHNGLTTKSQWPTGDVWVAWSEPLGHSTQTIGTEDQFVSKKCIEKVIKWVIIIWIVI